MKVNISNKFLQFFYAIDKILWRARPWESVEKFVSSQKKWKPWGIVFFILTILGLISRILNPES